MAWSHAEAASLTGTGRSWGIIGRTWLRMVSTPFITQVGQESKHYDDIVFNTTRVIADERRTSAGTMRSTTSPMVDGLTPALPDQDRVHL